MPAPGTVCFGRHCFLIHCRPEKRLRRSCLRTGFVLNLRQSRPGATGKDRRENGARTPDEEFAFSRGPELLRRARFACAANRGIAPLEPGEISRAEGVPALGPDIKSESIQF